MQLKVLTVVGVISLSVALSACEGAMPPSATPTPQAVVPTESSQPTEEPTPTPSSTPDPVSENPFELSDMEREIFDEYSVKKDINILKGVPPISVAKIFVECGITGNWEAEYGMYAPETVEMTKEEWEALNAEDINSLDIKSRRTMADDVFSLMDEGTVTETEDGKAVITFNTYMGEVETEMNLVKAGDIWLVKYDPFVSE